jgi:hypothetical protein
MTPLEDPSENVWLDEDAGPVVRPYAMTRGRTRPTNGDFDLIALIMATQPVPPGGAGLGPEHVAIVNLCTRPQSVAEISAHLDLPVGIVRVLLGDLLDGGFILAREPRRTAQMPSEPVLKAVISGLRSL